MKKWIAYNNAARKRPRSKPDKPAQTMPKADLHLKKVMLSVWWDYQGAPKEPECQFGPLTSTNDEIR
ncbi:hypothetical protein OESDEN_17574 [Oesophagostomum dentatum]|uniref:Uncharacterized protein n=1 Tax=Oesophagostomum dentatum TaxID=61180 RepID=A0A0B1SFS1_OESDE|nr:hypothetical protein OESDEN_17574 [Oesophagostomum dentatum]